MKEGPVGLRGEQARYILSCQKDDYGERDGAQKTTKEREGLFRSGN